MRTVGIQMEDARMPELDGQVGMVALLGEVIKRMTEQPRSGRAGNLRGPVGRSRVEHDDIIAAGHRRQAGRQLTLLVESQDEDGEHGATAQGPLWLRR